MPQVASCCFLRDLLDGVFARSSPDHCPVNKKRNVQPPCRFKKCTACAMASFVLAVMKPAKLATDPTWIKRKLPLGSGAPTSDGIARNLPSKAAFFDFLGYLQQSCFLRSAVQIRSCRVWTRRACPWRFVATLILRCSWQRLRGQPVHAQCRMSAAKTGKTEETYLLYHN